MSHVATNTAQAVCCPQCGAAARRLVFSSLYPTHLKCPGGLVNQVECPSCDYLFVSCAVNGQVVEAYAEGISTYQRPRNRPSSPASSSWATLPSKANA
ncbi:hypothetical protein [Acaryochloris sp. IP29b_bin.148]|uniref:hypothetical protein n=1 Tax=Acaryochloris sp. IP29b_bin.148 TaxID=2969218 RepID=UPI00263620F9|nr:hypothetical protein [Acaryochloris sp. IP29b_bin.148]